MQPPELNGQRQDLVELLVLADCWDYEAAPLFRGKLESLRAALADAQTDEERERLLTRLRGEEVKYDATVAEVEVVRMFLSLLPDLGIDSDEAERARARLAPELLARTFGSG